MIINVSSWMTALLSSLNIGRKLSQHQYRLNVVHRHVFQSQNNHVNAFAIIIPPSSSSSPSSFFCLQSTVLDKDHDLELTRQAILSFVNTKTTTRTTKGWWNSSRSIIVIVNDESRRERYKNDAILLFLVLYFTMKANWARYLERPKNDNMIRVAFVEHTEQTLVWLFHQTGRHLPEYHRDKVSQYYLVIY
jgi:hypothetical protein